MTTARELDKKTLETLRRHALKTLSELVTPQGIYASTNQGWQGPYHSWFGRDTAITADFIFATLPIGGDTTLAQTAWQALSALASWQGSNSTLATGEAIGKLPHEIRTSFNNVDSVQHQAGTNIKPWYIDPNDTTLKNWDSADATPLWILAICRGARALSQELNEATRSRLELAGDWILNNLHEYDGLVGFSGADVQPGRVYSGLHNQGWKDSEAIYQLTDGAIAPHPIKDVLINAEAWAALRELSHVTNDPARKLSFRTAANQLRENYLSTKGFVLPHHNGLAQAIDGKGHQLPQQSVDEAAVIWAYDYSNSLCLPKQLLDTVIHRVMSPTMLNRSAGVRNYAQGTQFVQGTKYHGSSATYWPFMSGLIARGMSAIGYHTEAVIITKAYITSIATLGSNIEMFVETSNHNLQPWHHPDIDQQSAREQAWTAAAVYYGTSFLLAET